MSVSYDRLWHILIDKHWSKTKLRKEAGISTNAMAKIGRNEDVRVGVLVKICEALECDIEDIMEIVSNAEPREGAKHDRQRIENPEG